MGHHPVGQEDEDKGRKGLCEFTRAAVTKYDMLSTLNNTNLFPHSSGGGSQQGWFLLRSLLACSCLPPSSVLARSSLPMGLCPNLLFFEGHQSYWIAAHPDDHVAT